VLTSSISRDVIGSWDRFNLEKLLVNLLTNAIKYGNSKPISLVLVRIENSALLSIQDNGVGIAEKLRGKIFERFERCDPAGTTGGLGLGLYIVKSIVDAHGGAIQVESELGKGSKFTVKIPLNKISSSTCL
jgi:signal transduction histidine kinase